MQMEQGRYEWITLDVDYAYRAPTGSWCIQGSNDDYPVEVWLPEHLDQPLPEHMDADDDERNYLPLTVLARYYTEVEGPDCKYQVYIVGCAEPCDHEWGL